MSRPKPAVPLTAEEIDFVRGLVIYEDEHVLALNKPAGLSSQGGRIRAATLDDLLAGFAKASGVRPRLVHRLDRDTSGLILAARSKPAATFLGRAMMGRRIRKTYLALVAAAPEPSTGRIEASLERREIGREAYVRIASADEAGAQSAATLYRTLAHTKQAALVELRPLTGRMHQLRVHLASIGRPVLGDARYGGALAIAGRSVPRLMLHASALAFPNPGGGETRLAAPLPKDMAGLAAALGLLLPEQAARSAV